jgi:hypothetical protein
VGEEKKNPDTEQPCRFALLFGTATPGTLHYHSIQNRQSIRPVPSPGKQHCSV